MFLTTIRTRRARLKTIRELGITPPADTDLMEVWAHGQVVAVATVQPVKKGGRVTVAAATCLWVHPQLTPLTVVIPKIKAVVDAAIALTDEAQRDGLCERVDREQAA